MRNIIYRQLFAFFFILFSCMNPLTAWAEGADDNFRKVAQVGHSGSIKAFDVSKKFPIIASGGNEPDIYIWDSKTLKLLRKLKGHKDWIDKVKFTTDGKRLVSIAKDNTVYLWDTQSGEEIVHLNYEGINSISDFVLSPVENKMFITMAFSQNLMMVNLDEDFKPVVNNEFKPHKCSPLLPCKRVMTYSRDGQTIFITSGTELFLLNNHDLKVRKKIKLADELVVSKGLWAPEGIKDSVIATLLSFSASENNYLALLFRDGHIELRDEKDGELIWEKDLSKKFEDIGFGFFGDVLHLSKRNVLRVGREKTSVFLDVMDGSFVEYKELDELPIKQAVEIDPDTIAYTTYKRSVLEPANIEIYDLRTDAVLKSKSKNAVRINDVDGAADAPRIVFGSYDLSEVRVFDIRDKSFISQHKQLGIRTSKVSISADGQYVAANGQGSVGGVWDVKNNELVKVLGETTYTQYSIQLSNDGKKVLFPNKSGSLEVSKVKEYAGAWGVHDKNIDDYAMPVLSHDENHIAVGSTDEGVRIYHFDEDHKKRNSPIAQLPFGSLTWTLGSSPYAPVFAAGEHGGEVLVADWSGKEIAHFDAIQPHYPNQAINALDVSSDGNWVVMGNEGGKVCLLDVIKISRNCFFDIGVPVDGIAFVDHDKYIAMVNRATLAYIFDAKSLKPLMTIELYEEGAAITDLVDNSVVEVGADNCIEVSGYEWRPCKKEN